ncbi:hypothetical protein ASE36_00290 [Rhizobium sp. Root274]|uniref:DUF4238 domain-containing protein n=1 Tax=unclassified Rhizobium TaxID=2613769 RepID=UPI000713E89B|nr:MULTISPECIES: DUF4238 domain-containing protein [unclassified Rhizobium]KQW30777.1 hypothetical protein ASC71_00290 [Rhizobium sp. Root1240]KRD32324.1 hypothetical protein ASE36_00290 [Rhizobium sp. Root274]
MQNPPKKHHFIPAFYLRRWAVNGRVVEFSMPHKTVIAKAVGPEYTGFQERLYELEGFEPELAQQVEERFFKPVDTMAADALENLHTHGNAAAWTVESRSAWTRFMISMLLRGPDDIATFRKQYRKDWVETTDEMEARYRVMKTPDDPETFAEWLSTAPLQLIEKHQFEIFFSLIDNHRLGGTINNMDWRVIEIPRTAHELLTSDRPIIRSNALKPPYGHIAIPIGPRKLFLASEDTKFLAEMERVDRHLLARETNRAVVEGAGRFVYSTNERQHQFVANRFGTNRLPSLFSDVLRPRNGRRGYLHGASPSSLR